MKLTLHQLYYILLGICLRAKAVLVEDGNTCIDINAKGASTTTISQAVYPPNEEKLYRMVVACLGSTALPATTDNVMMKHYRGDGESCLSLSHNQICFVERTEGAIECDFHRYAIFTRSNPSPTNPVTFSCPADSLMAFHTWREIYSQDGQDWVLQSSNNDIYHFPAEHTTASLQSDNELLFKPEEMYNTVFVATGCGLKNYFDQCANSITKDVTDIMRVCQETIADTEYCTVSNDEENNNIVNSDSNEFNDNNGNDSGGMSAASGIFSRSLALFLGVLFW